jgi:hypothetical protein
MTRYSTVGFALLLGLPACGDDGDGRVIGASATDGDVEATTGEEVDGSTTSDDDDESADGESSDGAVDETTGSGLCTQADFDVVLEPPTPKVMVLLDKSNSMNAQWDHDADPLTPNIPRWTSLYHVVEHLLGEFQHTTQFGSLLFPGADSWLDEPTNDWSCIVSEQPEVPVGPMNAQAILESIPPAQGFSISGGTPAVAAFETALEHLLGLQNDQPKAVVLVTDGAANCSEEEAAGDTLFVYDARLSQIVEDAYTQHEIPTYVVGIDIRDFMGSKPAVNTYHSLSEVALAGGVPREGEAPFYNSVNEHELADALDTVLHQIECTVKLPEAPEYPDEMKVDVDGLDASKLGNCSEGDGWAWTHPNGPHTTIELCGVACDALQDVGAVGVHYGCPE